jgi:hypothetical protein
MRACKARVLSALAYFFAISRHHLERGLLQQRPVAPLRTHLVAQEVARTLTLVTTV